MLLGAPGRTTRSKDATRGSWPGLLALILGARMLLGAPVRTTRSKGLLALLLGARMLLGAPGRTTRSKDTTRGSWHY